MALGSPITDLIYSSRRHRRQKRQHRYHREKDKPAHFFNRRGRKNDRAVMGLQNLIHKESVFSRVLSGHGNLFPNRLISGPIEMVTGAKVETRDSVDVIVKGAPSWPAMTIEECQGWLEDLTLRSWLTECQHDVNIPYDDATFREFDPVYHCITISEFMRYYVGNKAIRDDLQPVKPV